MWKLHAILVVLALSGCCEAKWKQTFAAEFNEPAGSAPGDQWVYDIGTGSQGWGNFELEYYTDNLTNAQQDGEGHLTIVAIKEEASSLTCWNGPCQFTSARIRTQGTFQQQYGRFEVRAKVPTGQGLWPAFWMLGSDFPTVGWPQCGEIDIMEIRGSDTNSTHGTIHGPDYSGADGISSQFNLPAGRDFSDGYHVFSVEWGPRKISWAIDGKTFASVTPAQLPAGAPWVFNHPFFMILNLAVGGQFDGNPASTLSFPQTLYVDYVRAYQNDRYRGEKNKGSEVAKNN